MQEEIWKDIPNYEGRYQVSNLGRVQSLSRKICNTKRCYISKEIILKQFINMHGYVCYKLCNGVAQKTFSVHKLVAMAFLNHIPDGTNKIVVDHINDIKTDNRLKNLQLITNRENAYRTQGKYSSKYKGVSWCKKKNKWRASIRIHSKSVHLGYFLNEHDAYLIYQNKLELEIKEMS